jgi:hypothetical protein
MTTCPSCNSALRLTISNAFGWCWHCSHQSGEISYVPIGHSRRAPHGRTIGQAARDEGAALVLENAGQEWRERIAGLIDDLARRLPDLTADDVRAEAVRVGAGQPHHANAWGAAMLAAAKRGSIRRTMTLRQSGRAEANSHANPVWASLIHEPKGMAIRAEEQLEVW